MNIKQILNTLMLMCTCTLAGAMISAYAITGMLPTFTQSESIAVPDATKSSITEVQAILEEMPDKEYKFGYTCIDFARDAKRELRWHGIPSLTTGMSFETGDGHALLLVPTTDEGYVFIDKQSGLIVRPVTGGFYGGSRITSMYVEVPHWILLEVWWKNPVFEVIVNE